MTNLAQVKAALLERIDELLRALGLPEPTKGVHPNSREMRIGGKGSLVIHRAGPRAGSWHSFEDGIGGDLIALVAWVRGTDQGAAIRWAADWVGVDRQPPTDEERRRRRPVVMPEPPRPANTPPAVWQLWQRRREPVGSPVAQYLAARALAIPVRHRWLGYVPELEYFEGTRMVGRWPAMIAAIQGPDKRLIGIHRTYLRIANDGRIGKAAVAAPKKVLGAWQGGTIRVTPATGQTLVLAEGIETTLSVAQACGLPAWAVICVDNFRFVEPPTNVREIVLAGDGDEAELMARIVNDDLPTTAAGRALARAVGRFRMAGLRVRLAVPPARVGEHRDWNDVLRGAA